MLQRVLQYVVNARSDETSGFVGLFTNHWLWTVMALSGVLQVTAVYVPVLQQALGTVGLSAEDWRRCIAIASSMLWVREIGKLRGCFARCDRAITRILCRA